MADATVQARMARLREERARAAEMVERDRTNQARAVDDLERLVILARLLVPIAVVLVLHEGIHALCLWLFTHERPTFVATFGGGGGIGVIATSCPIWECEIRQRMPLTPRECYISSYLAVIPS